MEFRRPSRVGSTQESAVMVFWQGRVEGALSCKTLRRQRTKHASRTATQCGKKRRQELSRETTEVIDQVAF